MYIHFGQRPYGKCDVVPELFYVATWFFHFDFVPLVPLGTRLVLGQTGNKYHVVSIPFSAKSLIYAWVRTAAFFGIVLGIILALAALDDRQMQGDTGWEMALLLAAASAIVYAYVMIFPRRRMPSYERACQLGVHAGLDERGWAALNVLYGRDPFERPGAADAVRAR